MNAETTKRGVWYSASFDGSTGYGRTQRDALLRLAAKLQVDAIETDLDDCAEYGIVSLPINFDPDADISRR